MKRLLTILCVLFAVSGAYLTAFGSGLLYTGREYGMAILTLAVVAYCGVNHDA